MDVGRTFKKNIKSGINYLEIPDKDKDGNDTNDPDKAVSWEIVSDPVDINMKLIERNVKHFGQAEGTDLLLTLFVNYSTTKAQANMSIF